MPFLQTLGGGSAQGFRAGGAGAGAAATGGYDYFYTEGGVYYKCHIFNVDYASAGKFGGLTLTVNSAITNASVFCVGGGGGGANFAGDDGTYDANGGGAGGGGAAACLKTADLAPGDYTVVVGAGGAGGNGQAPGTSSPGLAGAAGSASTFVGTNFNLSAGGGGGGQPLPNGNDSGAGTGGSASGGDSNWSGGAGGNGQRNTGTNTNKNPNSGADGNGAGGGCSGADDPDSGGVTALGKGGDGSVDRLGPFGCGGGGGGAIDYGGSTENGTHPASNQDNTVHGGLGYRCGGHGSRQGRPPRDGQGPYAGQKGLENWNNGRSNCGAGGGYPGGGGGGGSDERNSGYAHDGGDGANGMVVVRYTLDEAPVASDFAYPSPTNYPGEFTRDGSSGKGFHSTYEAEIAGKANGSCYFRNALNVEKELYIHTFTGSSPSTNASIASSSLGTYILVASSNWGSGTFPGGSGKNATTREYQVDRNGDYRDTSSLGTADPNLDYIIGAFVHSLAYHRVKIFGWGRGDHNNAGLTWPNNCNSAIDVTWQAGTIHQNRDIGSVTWVNSGGAGGMHSGAQKFCGDGIYGDWQLNANANQSTIGGVGTGSTTYGLPDSGGGCLVGHGASEGDGEGWYDTNGNADGRGYTTWVR